MFKLIRPNSEKEWECYHHIRDVNIFTPINVLYDRQHPSLRAPNNYHYIFLKEKSIIGTLQLEVLEDNSCAIRTIAIADPNKGKGYGSVLLKFAENEIRELGCMIIHIHANHQAERFYVRNGYIKMEFPNDISVNATTIDYGKILS